MDSSTWSPAAALPKSAALAARLGTHGSSLVTMHVEQALVRIARDLAERPSKQLRARLVGESARLIGGPELCPQRLADCAAVVELVHGGSLIIDDIQDASSERRGGESLHRRYGTPQALCAGNWLYFWPLAKLAELQLTPLQLLAAHHLYHESLEQAHYGQALDLTLAADALPAAQLAALVRAIAGLKTGSITGLAAGLGALIGGADDAGCKALTIFGRRFGEALQALDDFSNLLPAAGAKRFEDLRLQRPTAVWALVAQDGDEALAGLRLCSAALPDTGPLEVFLMRHEVLARGKAQVRDELEAAFGEVRRAVPYAKPAALAAFTELKELLLEAYL